MKKQEDNMMQVCQYLRDETMKGFDDLKRLKQSGNITEADLDYELARDRKAGIALKTIVVEMNVEKLGSRRINQIENKPEK